MSLTPDTFWLTTAKYIEQKRAVVLEFSNSSFQESKKFAFFPEMHLPKELSSAKEIEKILSSHNPQKFVFSEEENCYRVIASTFSDLLSLAEIVFQHFSFKANIIEPERQFLLQKNWSYFDCFEIKKNSIRKLSVFSVPDTRISLLAETISKTLEQLLLLHKSNAELLAESIVLSNVCCLPIAHASSQKGLAETFLQNLLFSNRFCFLPLKAESPKYSNPHNMSERFSTEIDFSGLWAELLTNNYYNLGFETVDCNCCKPEGIFASNVLPHSLVETEFSIDGFFFDSALPSFASSFHEKHENKESRIKRKEEFFLPEIPVGPFFRNEQAAIPLADAVELSKANCCSIIKEKELHWFCGKREAFVSKAIKGLKEKISRIELLSSEIEAIHKKSFGLFFSEKLAQNPGYVFLQQQRKQLEAVLSSLPVLLSGRHSGFFFPKLSESIAAVQFLKMQKFRQYGSQKGLRQLLVSGQKAFLSADSALEVITDFSQRERIPAPVIVREKNLKSPA